MNRLVIIGNGFDLAHGLPTGYCDFINDYWRKFINNIPNLENQNYEDDLIEMQFWFKFSSQNQAKKLFKSVSSYSDLKSFIHQFSEVYDPSHPSINYDRCYLKFHNSFFQCICDKHSIQNWVDIENEYYQLLKDCLNEEDNFKVKKLNEEFEQVKNLLEEYLEKNIHQRFNFEKPNENIRAILQHFFVKPQYFNRGDNNLLMQFPTEDHKELIEFDNKIIDLNRAHNLKNGVRSGNIVQDNLILNFNYTKTFDNYINIIHYHLQREVVGNINHIQIHGKLGDSNNKINFGFGDEMDKSYAEIEEKDDNEYLKNIKSFQYLQNSNYKSMLDFVERDKFQVYIMGHSCGLSDRILLNTIFEHHNCRSIKVFYYENGDWDNYTDIVQNISRHFNKKKLMRDKIVNKSLCEALPQDIRFEEKNNSPE